jgi:hypothetical protein
MWQLSADTFRGEIEFCTVVVRGVVEDTELSASQCAGRERLSPKLEDDDVSGVCQLMKVKLWETCKVEKHEPKQNRDTRKNGAKYSSFRLEKSDPNGHRGRTT